MSVHRLAKYQTDDPFTRVPNTAIDGTLSLKALGLLVFMLSKPDGWRFTERGLLSQLQEGRHALASAMQELITAGYVRRRADEDGNLRRMVTEVYDRPCFGFPSVGFPERRETEALSNEGSQVTNDLSKSASTSKAKAQSRKVGIPDGWSPSPEQSKTMQETFPKLVVIEEVERFGDYHRSKGSKFADWDAAFRNWCRNAEKFRKQNAGEKDGGWR